MGLIKAAVGSVAGVLADQWLEFFVCESLDADVLAAKGAKRSGKRGSNTKAEDNIISNGSGIVVNAGQAAIIVDQGGIVEFCAEEGHYTYDKSSEPSIFYGGLGKGIGDAIKNMMERFKYGGAPGKDQRVYYFNTKEIPGNKYGTQSPIPFLVVDPNINLRLTISLRCNGEYSLKITNPALFYANVCGNVEKDYTRDKLDSQLKSELLTAMQPAFAALANTGIEYYQIPGHAMELGRILNEELSASWRDKRGIEIVSFAVNAINASKEDEDRIKNLQTAAVMRDPTMAAASLVNAQGDAMRTAAGNPGGAFGAFMGMGMANAAGGMNPSALFQMGAQQQAGMQGGPGPGGAPGGPGAAGAMPGSANAAGAAGAVPEGWTCSCGHVNTGKFCAECGKPRGA
jgi:membrane protease subunit (stomatin/prohibitin family)